MKEKIFTGSVGRTLTDTVYNYKTVDKTPENAPNVVYIVLDDLGFAGLGCYGSNIHTPNLDRLANEGLRYNNFHTTAICSATRASLLTGANHHAAGVSSLIEIPTGCSNSSGHVLNEYATTAEILKEYGYATFAAGKWHLSRPQSPSGPYDQWPLARGFDRYYGYLTAEADHYHPPLVRDNSFVEQPKSVADGYHFTSDITDNAIDFIFQHVNSFPNQPFFLYLAHGAMHSPHQAPMEYIDKYKGKFDEGWDVIRQQWFENQKRIGIIPQDAELTDRAEYVPAWDTLDDEHKRLYARYMEVFAGTLEYTDAQIGRLIDYLERVNKLDDTVIVFLSDNGSSPEGGIEGRINRHTSTDLTSVTDEAEYALEHIDEIGTEYSFSIYPTGWANLLNTPFQWYKMFTHEGGVKDPMIIRYPKLIPDAGAIRPQYHHVSDITPTILDIIGKEKPEYIKGVHQKPFTGTSFKYTLTDGSAKDRKLVQYYEILGNRSIYKNGWKANVNHTFSSSYKDDVWELYHVAEDYSEKYNVADKYPEKLRELQDEFFIEAGKNNVFPMLNNTIISPYPMFPTEIPMVFPERDLNYYDIFKPYRLIEDAGFRATGESYQLTAEINRPQLDEGVIFSIGTRFGGYTLYIKDNRLKFVYNAYRFEYYKLESENELPAGKITVGYRYIHKAGNENSNEYYGKNSSSGTVELLINGEATCTIEIERLLANLGCNADPTIRANFYTEISPEYEVPFEFTGDIIKLNIHFYGSEATREQIIQSVSSAD